MMELHESSRAFKSDFTIDIYSLNYMCDQSNQKIFFVKKLRKTHMAYFYKDEISFLYLNCISWILTTFPKFYFLI